MTETTDGVQELNEQDLQKVTGGKLKLWGNTVQDYEQYKLERQKSLEHHERIFRLGVKRYGSVLGIAGRENIAAKKSREGIAWADKNIARKQGR